MRKPAFNLVTSSKRRQALAGASGLFLVAYGVWQLGGWYKVTKIPESEAVARSVVTTSTSEPSEADPLKPCERYGTGSGTPKAIQIPSLSVDSCVQQVGLDQDNAVAVPSNVHLAGWFTKSPAPGEVGVSVIDGHVKGKYRDGIFLKLGELKVNDLIRIQNRDSSWHEFKVVDTATLASDEAGVRLFSSISGVERQLNLITCAGSYDDAAKTYDQRVVVRAKLVK